MEILVVETFAQMAFWVVVGLTLAGACIAVFPKNILYNVLGLALALTGVAGFYLFLGSMFIALMQLLIYVGAITISIVFAIMLSRPLHLDIAPRAIPKVALAGFGCVLVMAAMLGVVFKTNWAPAAERGADWSVETIGHMLLTKYMFSFELISLVLLVAIIGAIVTAGSSRRLSS